MEIFRAVIADVGVQFRVSDEVGGIYLLQNGRDAALRQQAGGPGLFVIPAAQDTGGQGFRRNVLAGDYAALLLLFQRDLQPLGRNAQDDIAIA